MQFSKLQDGKLYRYITDGNDPSYKMCTLTQTQKDHIIWLYEVDPRYHSQFENYRNYDITNKDLTLVSIFKKNNFYILEFLTDDDLTAAIIYDVRLDVWPEDHYSYPFEEI